MQEDFVIKILMENLEKHGKNSSLKSPISQKNPKYLRPCVFRPRKKKSVLFFTSATDGGRSQMLVGLP